MFKNGEKLVESFDVTASVKEREKGKKNVMT